MKKNNTYSKAGFVWAHIFWTAVSMIWYKHILFRCLDRTSLSSSKITLWLLITGICAFAIMLEFCDHRNGISIFANLTIAYGAYTALAYFQAKGTLIAVVLIIALILSLSFSALVLFRRFPRHRKLHSVVWKRVTHSLCFSRFAFTGAFLVLFVALGFRAVWGESLFHASVQPASMDQVSQQTISNNIETVLQLQEDEWQKLSVDGKLNVLQVVANIEQRYLGIPFGVTVGAANLGEDELGTYNDRTHEITIDLDCLLNEQARECLVVVCHEAYHCYQHCVVSVYNELDSKDKQLLLFYPAEVYTKEFQNYQDGSDDILGYYLQRCEIDARAYGDSAADDYYAKIDSYLNEGSSN